jgi:signal transduction histidine kinase
MCDPAQIEQALLALCINAVEAMPNGGALTLRTAPTADGGVQVVVEDTGVGIPPEVRAHIFEPFFTTKGEGEGKGLGLGLAVVYGIVERHNGAIDVSSVPGQGTRFTLTVPAAPASGGGET